MTEQEKAIQNRLNHQNRFHQMIEGLKFTADELHEITFERDKLRETNGELVIKLDNLRHKNAELLEALKEMVNNYELEASPENPALLQANLVIAKAEVN